MNEFALEHMKNILEEYRYYCSIIKKCAINIYEIDIKRGVHAVRYDKEATQGSSDPISKNIAILELIDKRDELEKKMNSAIDQVKSIAKILHMCQDKQIMRAIYLIHCKKESTYDDESKKIYLHEKTLQRKVNRELRNIYANVHQDTI